MRVPSFTLLAAAAEGACQLLAPLRWQHVIVPLLPAGLTECAEAPFFMGLHSLVSTLHPYPLVLGIHCQTRAAFLAGKQASFWTGTPSSGSRYC